MYPNQDAIFERLETTKRFGLLADYLVSWTGRPGRLSAKVTVWGKDGTPTHVVQGYICPLAEGTRERSADCHRRRLMPRFVSALRRPPRMKLQCARRSPARNAA
jgi:hypothetical protein